MNPITTTEPVSGSVDGVFRVTDTQSLGRHERALVLVKRRLHTAMKAARPVSYRMGAKAAPLAGR